jgi:Suppressor of fused protein (SUFU)
LVDEHVALLEGETVRAPRELGVTMMLVGAPPDRFMPGIVRFGDADPPLEVVWLLPFHESEHHVISQHGWRELMRLLDERELDPFDLAREALL